MGSISEIRRTRHHRRRIEVSCDPAAGYRGAGRRTPESWLQHRSQTATDKCGRALGQSGDDGVIDQDPLGVDQIFVQAKRYAEGRNISAGDIRDFYGARGLKKAHKGIFVTTSAFSQPAVDTARGLGSRIVLIDGLQLSRLMIRYNVGCRDEDVLHLKKVDEDFFEA